ncbi:MAG: hypothetical protein LUE29_12530 [Lachnospiraceae bacterium]|nr:hypothetical protein [Lachnospiraceae bacterium]
MKEKLKNFMKNFILSRHLLYVFLRFLIFCVLLIVGQTLFLLSGGANATAGGGQEFTNTVGRWLRNIGLVLCAVEFLRQINYRALKDWAVQFVEGVGRFFLGVLERGVEFISKLFSLTKRDGDRMQKISKYTDVTVKASKAARKKRTGRRWKAFSRMDNNEKIRYFYWRKKRTWRRDGVAMLDTTTPRELLHRVDEAVDDEGRRREAERLIGEYQNVRYRGDYQADSETVEAMGKV